MYLMGYVRGATAVYATEQFDAWLRWLRDTRAKSTVLARIDRLSDGNAGDCAPIGEGVSEMRIHGGPGYRVYFVQLAAKVVVLLAAGDKRTQPRDIERARGLARNLSWGINA